MNIIIRGILVTGIILICSVSNVFSMRCTNGIVITDDSVQQIIKSCGEPNSSSGDFWGDRGVMNYEIDGVTWTVTTLNGRVTDTDMHR